MRNKIKVTYTINKEVNDVFVEMSKQKSLNKSLFVENVIKGWISGSVIQ